MALSCYGSAESFQLAGRHTRPAATLSFRSQIALITQKQPKFSRCSISQWQSLLGAPEHVQDPDLS